MLGSVPHPSKKFYMLAALLFLLAFVFSICASVIPRWSRIPGASGGANFKYFFDNNYFLPYVSTNVDSGSNLYLGHWQWCLYYGNKMDTYTCGDSQDESFPAFGRGKCVGNFEASRILTIIAIVCFFLCLLLAAFLFMACKKWSVGTFWSPPMGAALALLLLAMVALGCAIAAWATWMGVAETRCLANKNLFNPFQGYSTSFILMCFASGFGLLGMLLACLGLAKLKKIPQPKAAPKEEIVYVEEPAMMMYEQAPITYPVTMDSPYMAPVSYAPAGYPSTPLY